MSIGSMSKEFAKEIGAEAIASAIVEALKDLIKTAKDKGTEQLKKDFSEYRSELFAFIGSLKGIDPVAYEGLMKAHELRQFCLTVPYNQAVSYKQGDENKMITVLTTLYKYLSEKGEEDDRMEIFQGLGHQAKDHPQAFDQAMAMLDDDKVPQFFKRVFEEAKNIFAVIGQYAPQTAIIANNALNQGANALNQFAQAVTTNDYSTNPNNGAVNAGKGILNLGKAIWFKGNSIARGFMAALIGYLAIWLAISFTFGMLNMKAGVVVMGTICVAAMLFFFAIAEPVVTSAVFTGKEGILKSLRKWLFIILTGQLLIGLYLYIVPIHTEPLWFFVVLAAIFVTIFLHFSGINRKSGTYRWIIKIMTFIAIGMSVLLLLGGPIQAPKTANEYLENTKEAISDILPSQSEAPAAQNNIIIDFTTNPNDEGGTFICEVSEGQKLIVRSDKDFRLWLGGNNYSETYKAGIANVIWSTGTGGWYFKTTEAASGSVEFAE